MTYEKGSRGECLKHYRIRCGECEYVAELEAEVFRLQDELKGDGVLTLSEQVSHARSEIRRQDAEIEYLREGLSYISESHYTWDSPEQVATVAKDYLNGEVDR